MKTTAAVIIADLDEMVFEDRERGYGAYFLRKTYNRHLTIGLAIVFSAFFLFTFSPVIANMLGYADNEETVERIKAEITMTQLMQREKPKDVVKPPPLPTPPKPKVQTEFKIPEPSPNPEDETSTIKEMDTLKIAKNISTVDVKGDDDFIDFVGDLGTGDEMIPDIIIDHDPDPDVFTIAEEEPEPINMAEIVKEIGYPRAAQDAGLQGKVILRVLVDRNGKYKKHLILNSSHPIFSNAVEEKVNLLKFTPAIQGNKPIPFWVNIPFNFTLLGN